MIVFVGSCMQWLKAASHMWLKQSCSYLRDDPAVLKWVSKHLMFWMIWLYYKLRKDDSQRTGVVHSFFRQSVRVCFFLNNFWIPKLLSFLLTLQWKSMLTLKALEKDVFSLITTLLHATCSHFHTVIYFKTDIYLTIWQYYFDCDGVDDGDGGGVIIYLRVHCVGNLTSHVFTSFPDIRYPCMVYVWYIPTKTTYLLFFFTLSL